MIQIISARSIQSRLLYGRHVSTRFLVLFRDHDEAGLSPAAECLVGVRLGLLNFLTPLCMDGLFWLLAFGAGGCLFWIDVVDTLPGSGLVGWCPESVFLFIRTQLQFLSRTYCQFGNRPREDSEKPRRSTKRNIGSCKA